MSNMTINCEFLAGTEINQAIKEAKNKAIIFDVAYMCFSFNGVNLSIGKNCDIDKACDEYKNSFKKGVKFICHS